MNKLYIALALGAGVIALSSACRVTIPEAAKAVKPFDVDRYLGKWYEIARLDFKFEKDLNNVTANYSKGEEGVIKVLNRGYNVVKKEWKQSSGKAKFVRNPEEARLKVSFFGPFYAGYNVIAIDQAYQYALVAGNDLDYLWILSREKSIPEDIKNNYLQKAKDLGYQTQELVWTKHD
ncbi:MAG TPA: lipocalin family protein [Pedobacter sp.]|nr:lipocalin family protein [Pedobacter sp.]